MHEITPYSEIYGMHPCLEQVIGVRWDNRGGSGTQGSNAPTSGVSVDCTKRGECKCIDTLSFFLSFFRFFFL